VTKQPASPLQANAPKAAQQGHAPRGAYKLARSLQLFNSSPVLAADGSVVGDIGGQAIGRWTTHRSKRNTWTFTPNDEGRRRGLRLVRKFSDDAAPVRSILRELGELE
jgi:hypothetical protein